jgi:nucleoside 2-deoxyribosyltransferase/adenylate kinase
MQIWIVTGVSGCGRIELIRGLSDYAKTIDKTIVVHDVADLIQEECAKHRIDFSHQRILDLDRNTLRLLRVAALKETKARIDKQLNADVHFIGVHAMFLWKNRLIPGISYSDIIDIKPDGFLNVVDDVNRVLSVNKANPKWDKLTVPSIKNTMQWMQAEEFVTELFADVQDKPLFLVARQHNLPNLADLFFTGKKKIYLSYPITAVRDENPGLLEQIQGPILADLEKNFVVFNPLTIKDMTLTYQQAQKELPELTEQLTQEAMEIIKTRTVERDFQFIDQSDAIVVFYMTDKVSSGVLSEINYAHRNQKPVFMVYPATRSPFIEDTATYIGDKIEPLMARLDEFASSQNAL